MYVKYSFTYNQGNRFIKEKNNSLVMVLTIINIFLPLFKIDDFLYELRFIIIMYCINL